MGARHRPGTIDPAPLGEHTPLRLEVAAKYAFPDGSMTASGLRRERAKGRLVVERIAGKDYTTLHEIERMRELCRTRLKEPGSISGPQTRPARPSGSSGTPERSSALDSLLMNATRLSKGLPPISQKSTVPTDPATVIPLKSR